MRRLVLLALVFPLLIPAPPARAEEPLVQKVRASLNEGIKFLKSQQKDQGRRTWNWENDTLTVLQPGGSSCLAMLALLTAGVPVDDPVVKNGLPYIRELEPKHTYVVGLQTMVLAEAGDVKDLNKIERNVDWLLNAAVTRGKRLADGGKLEGWSYSSGGGNRPDNSNTQYALLGLWAGRQAGARIPQAAWESIHNFYKDTQTQPTRDARGGEMAGWNYVSGNRDNKGTLTMTAAGVSGLYIAAQELSDNKQELNEETGVAAKCGVYPDDDALARGMRWLAQEFRFSNPPHTFYNVYGIERVGRLSGHRFIGDHDWYREGCELLTGARESAGLAQKSNGEWKIDTAIDSFPVISTSFALLFLAKGRTPILLSKFAWDPARERPGNGTGWNRKHNDARHLVEYASRELFKIPGTNRPMPLAWQAYDARRADLSTDEKFNEELSTLLQSPILYMNGHEAPVLTPAQKKLLRRYVDEGGFILAEACCGSPEFAKGFRALMEDKDVFGNDSPLQPLSATHAIWSSHALVPANLFQGEQVPEEKKIQAIERGCKTVVVFSPQPLAGYWEEGRFAPKVGEVVGAKDRARQAYRLAGNIIAYATGFEPPKPRLDRPKVLDPKDDKPVAGARYMIQLAQVRHDGAGGWEPAKNALRALAVNARDKYLIDVSLAKEDVRMTKELWPYKFVYMHGKGEFTTDPEHVADMRAHLDVGATLLADACCGAAPFDKAFRDFAKKLYPDKKLEVIPADDFLYSEKLNGEAITRLRCRMEKADGSPKPTFEDVPPMLEGIKVDGRWAVIYSRYDIGCALEKNKSSACKGYDPDSAMKLATAGLLYSLKR